MAKHSFKQLPRRSLRETVYAALLESIVTGELAPGERLRDEALAAELGVSRTPVREALQRLEDEGLVETFPGALTRVTPLDVRDASDVAPVIAALRALATREAVPGLATEDLSVLRRASEELRAALARDDRPRALAANEAFHDVFVRVADNGALRRSVDRQMPRLRRLALARASALPELPFVRQHEEIMLAVGRDDARGAASHVEQSWLILGALLERTFAEPEKEGSADDEHDERD